MKHNSELSTSFQTLFWVILQGESDTLTQSGMNTFLTDTEIALKPSFIITKVADD